MKNIKEFFVGHWRKHSSLMLLIDSQVIIYLICAIFYALLSPDTYYYLALPADLQTFWPKAWTLLTYGWVHANILHCLGNLLMFYVFGRLFLRYLSPTRLVALFLAGMLVGGICFLLFYLIFQLCGMDLYFAPLLGSSAGVYALMCALLPKAGKSRIKLANFDVPLYSIILTILVLSLFKFGDNQSGGAVIAHLGGGLFGYLWIIIGRTTHVDILYPMTLIVNSFVEIFKNEPSPRKKESPLKDKQLDDILHKLRQSGYDALTDEEKRILFEQSKS